MQNYKKVLALIICMLVLGCGFTATLNLSANAEDDTSTSDTIEDDSEELDNDENVDEDEDEDSEESDDTSTSDEDLELLSYTEFSQDFISKLVIVGDSIASGFSSFGKLPPSQVLATGSVGARNIHEFSVTLDDKSMDVLDAISIVQPQYIFMSMGMNDVNISSKEVYISDYNQNIDDIQSICPKATIIVMGITPVIYYSDFTSNDTIDSYNEALKDMAKERRDSGQKVYYINVSKYLKDEQNGLKSEFSSGDGIHISADAYDYIFTAMMDSLNLIQ